VLATHLLPSGPKVWRLNEMADSIAMAVFFTLSGYHILCFICDSSITGSYLAGQWRLGRKVCKMTIFNFGSFVLTHISTFYYEKYWISLVKKITNKKLALCD